MRALFTAATGMKAQQLKVDSIANNIANVNTNGFKKSSAEFEDLYYEKIRTGTGTTEQGTTAADTVEVGHGARASQVRRDFRQGSLTDTGNPANMAINGSGFFGVTGADGQEVFTRNGNFAVDGAGNLTLPNGMALAEGIQIDATAEGFSIAPDGRVLEIVAGEVTEAGQIQLRTFVNPAGLEALGGGIYRSTDASGQPQTGVPGTEGVGDIIGGALEMSNVDVAEELIAMIQAQRAYELTGKVIEASDEMLQATNQLK